MTADIFSENDLTESNRMGIDRGEAAGPGASLTTSSEDSFSFSDNLVECDGNARAFGSMVANDTMVPLWVAVRTAHVLSSSRRSGTPRGSAGLTRCTANALLMNRCPDRGLGLAWLSA